jgi:hypothetical protein
MYNISNDPHIPSSSINEFKLPTPINPLRSLIILSQFDIVSYRRRISGLFTSITLLKDHFLKGMIEPQELKVRWILRNP